MKHKTICTLPRTGSTVPACPGKTKVLREYPLSVILALCLLTTGFCAEPSAKLRLTNTQTALASVRVDISLDGGETYTPIEAVDVPGNSTIDTQTYSAASVPGGTTGSFLISLTRLSVMSNSVDANSYIGDPLTTMDVGEYAASVSTADITLAVTLSKQRAPNVDAAKSLWLVTGDTLSAQVFREGIDKLAEGQQALADSMKPAPSGGGGDPTVAQGTLFTRGPTSTETTNINNAVNSALTDAASFTSARAAEWRAVMPTSVEQAGDMAAAELGDFSFGDIALHDMPSTSDVNIHVKPSDFLPNLSVWAGWIHEILLVMLVLVFAFWQQNKFEKYFIAFVSASEKTTKPETAQIAVAGVGWSKQVATATLISAMVVTAIAGTITFMNSQLGSLISGWELTNFVGHASTVVNSIFGNSIVAGAIAFISAFIPFAAGFQILVAKYLCNWSMPGIWTLAFVTNKYFHV